MSIVEATGLTKTYKSKTGTVHALAGLDLSVPRGTVKALLGPNGAGKTTVVKILTTLIRPNSGSASIDGMDVVARPKAVRRIIGVSGQYAAVDENLTGFENLEMVGRLYHLGAAASRKRAQELIDMFELTAAGNRPVKGFSGGMRRRIDLAGALVINPKVLFLDVNSALGTDVPRRPAARNGAEWKFRAVGQGFAGGLKPLAESYGLKF